MVAYSNNLNSLFLLGFRSSGKTCLGTLLAQKLNYKFHDTDFWVQKKHGQSIEDMVKEYGWDYFREKESQVLREMPTSYGVIATGGGIILNLENSYYMQEQGICIFLDTPCDILIERRKNDPLSSQRPAFTNEIIESIEDEVLRLYNERYHIYAKFAHYKVDNNEEPHKIIEKIITLIHAHPNA